MQKIRLLTLLSVFCWLSGHAFGQNVTGKVVDSSTKDPIIGASVSVVGTTLGAITNADGSFSVSLGGKSQGEIEVSFVGYKDQKLAVRAGQDYRIAMEEDAINVNDVVVVGFGTQKKANLTGAVSTIDVAKSFDARPITDVAKGLQGISPGLSITAPTGQIGENSTIKLRGNTGSLSASGNAQPLILVDNVEIPSLNMVNPEDIESISVLKDAASASIYGTRGAWGVILITTKTGKRNQQITVNYSNNFAWSTPTTHPEIAPIVEGAEARWAAYQRATPGGKGPIGSVGVYIDEASIQKMKDFRAQYGNGKGLGREMVEGRDFEVMGGKAFFYRPWDAPGLFMRDWTPQQKHDISVAGGGEKTAFNISVGSLSQHGVLKEGSDKFDRKNLLASINSTVNKYLDVRAKVMYSRTDHKEPYNFGSASSDPWVYLYRWPAEYPYGTLEGKPFRNAITEVQQANKNKKTSDLARINLGVKFNIIDGLTLDADYTYSTQHTRQQLNGGEVTAWDTWSGGGMQYWTYTSSGNNRVRVNSSWNRMNAVKAFFTYDKIFKQDHSFKAVLGLDLESYDNGSNYSEVRDLINMERPELALAVGDQYAGGTAGWWSTLGYFLRLNYSYKDRYLIELNGRIDGSTKFPSDDQWDFFPSGSVGWRISEEPFMKNLKDYYIPLLKLRASWGSVGNQNVGNNRFVSTMSTETSYWIVNGLAQLQTNDPTIVPPTLTWEKVTTLDIGADARFFDNNLGLTFDWYQRKTTDMISAGITLPSTYGAASPVRNYGEMKTTGWELGLDYTLRLKNGLTLTFSAGVSDYIEKITKFASNYQIYSNYEGKTIGEIWGYETDRFFTENDFQRDASGNLLVQGGKYVLKDGIATQKQFEAGSFWFGPGDIKYKDRDKNGEIGYGKETVQDHGDLKVIGNTTPRYQYNFSVGATWKGIDFSVFFQGIGKQSMWPTGSIFIPGFADAWYAHQMDYWTPEHTNAFYPRPTQMGQSNNSLNFLRQTKYLLNTAYLRCKNLTVGYTLPSKWTKKIYMQRARIYFSGENLFEFDHMKVPIDPETNLSAAQAESNAEGFGRVYPFSRVLSFGIQVTF